MASVVTPDPALPIEPASVLLPVLAPPSAIVRAWLLPCSVTGPVSVKTTAPEPEDSMKVTPADKVNNRLVEIGRASCREKSVSVRVDLGGSRIIKQKKSTTT